MCDREKVRKREREREEVRKIDRKCVRGERDRESVYVREGERQKI